jgi:hypothetical protein
LQKSKRNCIFNYARKKELTPKMLYQVHLQEIPEHNFIDCLIQLSIFILYKSYCKYYGDEGQESIDPVVFSKSVW